jgi:hypothetical protein
MRSGSSGLFLFIAAAMNGRAKTRGHMFRTKPLQTIETYHGPAVGCCWCAYEVEGSVYPSNVVPFATHVIRVHRGVREVCAAHAARGTWEARGRRVSVVA